MARAVEAHPAAPKKAPFFGAHNLIHGLKAVSLAGRGFPRGSRF